MTLAVIAYPTLSQQFYKWMKLIRNTYPELNYESLEPHFTLVFPISEVLNLDTIRDEIHTISQQTKAINFTIRCTIPMPSHSDDHYVFLVPDEGFSQVVELHDVLYSGIFAKYLRLDIPYIPHITIGYTQKLESVHRICQTINQKASLLLAL